ncbi:MAG TPA: hypothetical protein DEB31_00610 [Clostridiales bacterium]|nr:hypothetical protein [Clostridiales bacterium]
MPSSTGVGVGVGASVGVGVNVGVGVSVGENRITVVETGAAAFRSSLYTAVLPLPDHKVSLSMANAIMAMHAPLMAFQRFFAGLPPEACFIIFPLLSRRAFDFLPLYYLHQPEPV